LLGFPGALFAAYGVHYQAKHQIKPLNLPHIYRMFQVAGIALGVYAILTGLIVPPGDFPPANIINSGNLMALVGVPAPVFRSLAGLVIAVAVIRGLEVFDVEVDRQIEKMEIERSLVVQRERIGQELHDGAIQQVYTAGLIIESVRNKANDPLLDRRLENAMSAMNEAITGLRSYMENLRDPEAATPAGIPVTLVEGLKKQAADPRLTVLMQVDLDLKLDKEDSMSPVRTNRVLAIVSQALANAARHAQAHHVVVMAQRQQNRLLLAIEDDGRGFKPEVKNNGYGLRDMYDHARLLGGELSVDSKPGYGTRILLQAPWGDI
jgi:signal transduction histidine kinase